MSNASSASGSVLKADSQSSLNAPHRVIRIRARSNWRHILEHAYPLPPAPPEQCRDAFLAELLKPYESESLIDSLVSEDSIMSMKVKFVGLSSLATSFNAEEKLLNRMLQTEKRLSLSTRESAFTDSTLYAPDLHKLMRERYGNIATAIGLMSVIFNLKELRDRMFIVRDMWNMNVTVDKELRLFGWSIRDYFRRFTQPNLVYLDTAERLLGSQIECFKFRMDLREINRLCGVIIDDLRNKRDICHSSMVLLKDAEMDIEKLLTNSQREATEEHAKVTKAAANMPRSADPFGRREKAIHTKINHNDFVFPIEARYRINWAQTSMEQSILKVELHENHLHDELKWTKQQIEEVGRLWEISSIAYNMQIFVLKNDIMKREIEYEDRLEHAENQIQITRTQLAKAKDDLKYYRERIPFFHLKIEEVREILLRQEEEDNRKSARSSRKSSRHSSKTKLHKKAVKQK